MNLSILEQFLFYSFKVERYRLMCKSVFQAYTSWSYESTTSHDELWTVPTFFYELSPESHGFWIGSNLVSVWYQNWCKTTYLHSLEIRYIKIKTYLISSWNTRGLKKSYWKRWISSPLELTGVKSLPKSGHLDMRFKISSWKNLSTKWWW